MHFTMKQSNSLKGAFFVVAKGTLKKQMNTSINIIWLQLDSDLFHVLASLMIQKHKLKFHAAGGELDSAQ